MQPSTPVSHPTHTAPPVNQPYHIAPPAIPPDDSNAPATRHNHIPALDGLRGIAIIMVLIWHYVPLSQSFFPGWAGVDLFFVLSGYLITWRLLATRDHPHYFSRFYRNRALRIVPLYYILVIGFFLAVHFLVQPINRWTLDTYIIHWKSFLIFTENWTYLRYALPHDLSLVPLWSIAVEEQFYLLWPAIIFLLPAVRSRLTVFCSLTLLVLLIRTFYCLTDHAYARPFYNTFFRIDSFVIGALLYQLHDARIKIAPNLVSWMMLGSLAVLLLNGLSLKSPLPDDPFMLTAGYTLLALFFACVLHLAARPETNAVSIFLSGKFLRGMGKISYCLYLIHFPVLQVVSSRFHAFGINNWPGHGTFLSCLSVTIALAGSIGLSLLSYRYLESFFLALKK